MRENFKKLLPYMGVVMLATLVGYLFGEFAVGELLGGIGLAAAGVAIVGEPTTVENVKEGSPELLKEFIDETVVKIFPNSAPIDTLSRYAKKKKANSREVKYYSVEIQGVSGRVTAVHTEPTNATAGSIQATLQVDDPSLFPVSTTIFVDGVKGFVKGTSNPSQETLVLYVMKKADNGIVVLAFNGKKIGNVENCIPTIPINSKLIRMGRAASELDVQTSQYNIVPTPTTNFCQSFKCQIEESEFYQLTAKEASYTISDATEAAIHDMRKSMEKSFVFGVGGSVKDTEKNEVIYAAQGIWYQTDKTFEYTKDSFAKNDFIDLMKTVFTGTSASKRRILIGGSDFIATMSKVDIQKNQEANKVDVVHGINMGRIEYNGNILQVVTHEMFDEMGMSGYGMVIDPEFLQRYQFLYDVQDLDLKKSGQRNTEAKVITDVCCVCLQYPDAHTKIIPVTA